MGFTAIALCIILVFLLWIGIRKSGSTPAKVERVDMHPRTAKVPAMRSEQTFHWPSIGDFEFEVVGESYYQDALRRIASGGDQGKVWTAMLIPEHDNPHDDLAVRVEIEGLKVGHLSRDDARSFRRRLGAKKLSNHITACNAMITGGSVRKNGEKLLYGVMLDIKPFY